MTGRGLLLAALLALPASLSAQDTVIVTRAGLVDERAVRLFNGDNTTRLFGEQTITRSMMIRTDLGVLDGPLYLYGTVDGDLVAINADVSIYSGAEVHGNVLVVGGTLFVSEDAQVDGSVERHSERVGVRVVDGRLQLTGERIRHVMVRGDHRLRRSYNRGRSTLVLTTGGTYNRVEGLPVMGGPRLTWSDPATSIRLEAFGIWRTATGFDATLDSRDFGYTALADVRLGPGRQVELGGKAYDVVTPTESWQLGDDEIGLGTVLWHRDYRDYYLQRGFAGFARLHPAPELTLFGEIARDEATSVAARDPWTLFRGAELWRPNPAVDEGHFDRVTAGLDLDTRSGEPWAPGVKLHAEWERGRSDDVAERPLPLSVRPPLPLAPYQYDRLFGDLRLYQPVGWGGLTLRAVGGTVLGDAPLPVQRRFSLGGPDPMPGYAFRRFGCNEAVADLALPALCDHMVLFQAEYRGGLDINPLDGVWDHDTARRSRDWDWSDWDNWWEGPQLVLFADAGSAWLTGTPAGPLQWDVGAGLEIGNVGLYAARAIERDQPIRFFLRIHRRF
jgi:hypothetical protein